MFDEVFNSMTYMVFLDEFNVTGFEGSEKCANRRINRIYSLKTDSIVYVVEPANLNLDFPILDFDPQGFFPAQDMIFENKNFKAFCEKGYCQSR